jgi:hypothetical protein
MGMNVQAAELKDSGLWGRELRYLELPGEKPIAPQFSEWRRRPAGHEYSRVDANYKRTPEQKNELKAAFIECSWQLPSETTEKKKDYREAHFSGFDLSDAVFLRRPVERRRQARLFLRSRVLFGLKRDELIRSPNALYESMRKPSSDAWERRPTGRIKMEWLPECREVVMKSESGQVWRYKTRKRTQGPIDSTSDREDNFDVGSCERFNRCPPPPSF